MQLGLGIRARATTDLDVVFRGRVEAWLASFDEATALARRCDWIRMPMNELPGAALQPIDAGDA